MQQSQKKKKQEFTKALGKVLTRLRQESKRSARSISYEADMSKTTLLLSEAGQLDPQLTTFCKIAEAFYLTPEKLIRMVYDELPDNWTIIEEN